MKKAVMKEKSGKILGLLSGGKRRAFLTEGVAKMYGCKAAEKRRFGKIFKKDECQIFLSKEIVLGHPCIPRVRVNKGGDKRPSLRKRGQSWCEGRGGGTDTRRKGFMQNFM